MTVTHRTQCPICASEGNDTAKDNLIHYDDGGSYCFIHGTVTASTQAQSKPPKLPVSSSIRTEKRDTHWKGSSNWDWIPGTQKVAFHLHDAATGKQQGIKWRDTQADKKHGISMHGITPPLCVIPGTQRHDVAVIVEGETAAYSVPKGYAVYFLPGADNAKRVTEQHYAKLLRHSKIILALDNDPVGRAAAHDLAQHIPSFVLADITEAQTEKDVNDYLAAGRVSEWLSLAESAEVMSESPFHDTASLEAMAAQSEVGFSTGLKELDLMFGGAMPVGSLMAITGDKGAGKSTFTSWLVSQLAKHNKDIKLLFVSSEMREDVVSSAIRSSYLGKHLTHTKVPITAVERMAMESVLSKRLVMGKRHLMQDWQDLQASIMTAVRMGVNAIVVDVFNDYLPTERDKVDERTKWLSLLAQGTLDPSLPPVLIILVSHKKITDSQTRRSFQRPHSDDFLGGRAFTRHPSHMLSVRRNKHGQTVFSVITSRSFNLLEDKQGNPIDEVSFEYDRRGASFMLVAEEEHDNEQVQQTEEADTRQEEQRRAESSLTEPTMDIRARSHTDAQDTEGGGANHPVSEHDEGEARLGVSTMPVHSQEGHGEVHTRLPDTSAGGSGVQGVPDTPEQTEVSESQEANREWPSFPEPEERDTSRDVNIDARPPRFTPASPRFAGLPTPTQEYDNWQVPTHQRDTATQGHGEVAQGQPIQGQVRRRVRRIP